MFPLPESSRLLKTFCSAEPNALIQQFTILQFNLIGFRETEENLNCIPCNITGFTMKGTIGGLPTIRILSTICLGGLTSELAFTGMFDFSVSAHLCCAGTFQMNSIYDLPDKNSPQSAYPLPQPIAQFVFHDSGNVSAILGKTALLNCRVRGVGNRTVSWKLYSLA